MARSCAMGSFLPTSCLWRVTGGWSLWRRVRHRLRHRRPHHDWGWLRAGRICWPGLRLTRRRRRWQATVVITIHADDEKRVDLHGVRQWGVVARERTACQHSTPTSGAQAVPTHHARQETANREDDVEYKLTATSPRYKDGHWRQEQRHQRGTAGPWSAHGCRRREKRRGSLYVYTRCVWQCI